MNDVVLRVSGLEKAYRIWKSPGSRLTAAALTGVGLGLPMLRSATERNRNRLFHDFRALHNINFELRRGESVAIIGRNGSGKSTLLQCVAGTLPPTAGTVESNGRVAALLELGSGFNPEYTGRENVLMNAAVLGLSPQEAQDRFPKIVEFAEIGDFIDQPVKTYSTGMAVRLAFAVLTQIDPEILIIDEALAVGDFLFQQKCFDVIRRFRAKGCSLLFVSHSMGTVLELCDRAILLNGGKVEFIGSADEAVRLYEAVGVKALFLAPGETRTVGAETKTEVRELAEINPAKETDAAGTQFEASSPPAPNELGSILTNRAELVCVQIFDRERRETEVITSGSSVIISITLKTNVELDDPHVGFKIRDNLGRIIFETSSYCMRKSLGTLKAGQEIIAEFAFDIPLAVGEYSVVVGFANGGYAQYHYRELLLYIQGAKTFQIVKNHRDILWSGIVNVRPQLQCKVRDTQPEVVSAHG